MKMLLINQHFVAPQEPGFTRHYEMAKYCSTKGIEFCIVASDINYQTGKSSGDRKGLVTTEEIDGIQVIKAYVLASLHKSFFWRIVAFISFMFTSTWASFKVGKVDLVMGTSPPLFQAFSAWFVAFVRQKPFLLEIRDLWPDDAIDMGVLKNPIIIKLARWLENFLYARATHILVNSPAYRDYLLDKGIPDTKISFIAYGADIEMFSPDISGDATRDEMSIDHNSVLVGYAGALGLANDIYTLIDAANCLKNNKTIRFVLFGDGKERSQLEAKVRELGLANLTFAGPKPKTQMPQILAATDICVAILQDIKMFRTTYPNKVFDYMAAGKPVVLAIDGVIRDVVEKANAGVFVEPGNPQALAQAVLELSGDSEKRAKMGQRGRAYVVEHYDRRRQLDLLTVLFKDIASNRRSLIKHSDPASES